MPRARQREPDTESGKGSGPDNWAWNSGIVPAPPAREGLVEAIGAMRFRAKAKRRKASASGKSARSDNARYLSEMQVYWRRDCVEVCWSYPWRPAGFRFGGRPYNVKEESRWPSRSRIDPQYRKTAERPSQPWEYRTGREGVDGEGGGCKQNKNVNQGRQPPRGGSRRMQLPSLLGCYRGLWRYRSHSTPAEIPCRGTRSFMRAAICLTQSGL
jgi:hypothetical protein